MRLWDGSTGVPIATLEGHSSEVSSLSFLPDSSRLALRLGDKIVRLWDGSTGVPIATFKGPQSVYSLSHSPIDSRLSSTLAHSILRNHDGDAGASLCIWPPSFLSTKMLPISHCKSNGPSRHYYIQGTVPSSNTHIPLLWLLMDIPDIS